jgi:type II secretory ATPase GspE/PulE/Tfp pilus assembly ATPase PilB-like protein
MAYTDDAINVAHPLPLPALQERILYALENHGDNGPTEIVDFALCQGVFHGASDIHFEPWTDVIALRFRIDGIMQDVARIPRLYQAKVVSRIKVLAKMVVYRSDIPQDGRIDGDHTSSGHAMRVSSFPTVDGEKIVIRILGATHDLLQLDDLGFDNETVARLREIISRPQGTLLLTGPSSSGKTTTIYSLLRELSSHQIRSHIVTIEDPVEFKLERISQSQVNPQIGFTFDQALRALLRQDPEVIMVGEIRDSETSRMAIQAGLTGHLVISTIHSGTASGVFTRLLDMGIEPFLVASSLTGVLAQRLVRLNCTKCLEEYTPDPLLVNRFGQDLDGATFLHGAGCDACDGLGYRGRTAIGELLAISPKLAELILQRPTTMAIQEMAQEQALRTLPKAGLDKVRQGLTTLEELKRVLPPPEAGGSMSERGGP